MRLAVVAEAPPAQLQPTAYEVAEAKSVAAAKAKAAQLEEYEAALNAAKLSYTEFTALVANEFVELVPAWYRTGGLGVLPLERCIVQVHAVGKGEQVPAYWFMPQLYLGQRLLVEDWCANVKWKIINGYGINVTAWCKEEKPTKYLTVAYEGSGFKNQTTEEGM